MSPRWRVTLALVGLAVIALSLAALLFALRPLDTSSEQFRPAPTLFAPPQSGLWLELV